ncbi:FG-GAP repeat domain-containing protein, partial [Bacillus vallismortis]|uniref:FG-GAP repeat domain-containing protein n=1 Tax=Bacillus vallismortis TaxID=72361 RepID=UPI00374CB6BF
VYLGNGDGTFQGLALNTATGPTVDISLADLNGDGKFDLVATSTALSNEALILIGNGDGTFQQPRTQSLPGDNLVAIGDLNG